MEKEYFSAKVVRVSTEPKVTASIQHCGFLGLTRVRVTSTTDEHFIFCKIVGTDFLLKIKTTEDIINQAIFDGEVSVMLGFYYDFSCFHFFRDKDKEKIIEV